MTLHQAVSEWLDLSGHDIFFDEELKKLKQQYQRAEVSAMIHQITLERKNEQSDIQPTNPTVPEPRPELPPATEEKQETKPAQLRSRAKRSSEPLPDGMNR